MAWAHVVAGWMFVSLCFSQENTKEINNKWSNFVAAKNPSPKVGKRSQTIDEEIIVFPDASYGSSTTVKTTTESNLTPENSYPGCDDVTVTPETGTWAHGYTGPLYTAHVARPPDNVTSLPVVVRWRYVTMSHDDDDVTADVTNKPCEAGVRLQGGECRQQHRANRSLCDVTCVSDDVTTDVGLVITKRMDAGDAGLVQMAIGDRICSFHVITIQECDEFWSPPHVLSSSRDYLAHGEFYCDVTERLFVADDARPAASSVTYCSRHGEWAMDEGRLECWAAPTDVRLIGITGRFSVGETLRLTCEFNQRYPESESTLFHFGDVTYELAQDKVLEHVVEAQDGGKAVWCQPISAFTRTLNQTGRSPVSQLQLVGETQQNSLQLTIWLSPAATLLTLLIIVVGFCICKRRMNINHREEEARSRPSPQVFNDLTDPYVEPNSAAQEIINSYEQIDDKPKAGDYENLQNNIAIIREHGNYLSLHSQQPPITTPSSSPRDVIIDSQHGEYERPIDVNVYANISQPIPQTRRPDSALPPLPSAHPQQPTVSVASPSGEFDDVDSSAPLSAGHCTDTTTSHHIASR